MVKPKDTFDHNNGGFLEAVLRLCEAQGPRWKGTKYSPSQPRLATSGPWRALEVLGGIIVIAIAIFALADPQFTTQTLVIVIAAGLIIGGLFRISVGTFATVLPSPLRSLNVTGGVIAFVLGIAALLEQQAAVATLIGILAVALLLVGAVEIGIGVARHPPVWLKLLIVVIGVLTIILSVYVILDMSIGEGILTTVLALALLLVGIRNIVHGITGHHPIAKSVEAAVTVA